MLVFIKRKMISIMFILFAIFLVIYSNSNLVATRNGLKLWANNVIPSLFPFFIAVELLVHTNIVYYLSKFLDKLMKPLFNVPGIATFPFVMGLISGYPVGAKIVSDLYSNGACTKDEAERMLVFTNNSGPLFILGTVGVAFYSNSTFGIILLITHILASITVGIIFGKISKSMNKMQFYQKKSKSDLIFNNTSLSKSNYSSVLNSDIELSELGGILGSSIASATKSILMIGGFVTLFSVVISILERSGVLVLVANTLSSILHIDSNLLVGTLSGIIEFTNGLSKISQVHLKNISINIILSAFVLGFGGISVTLQVLNIVSKNNLSIKKYLLGKVLQGIIAAFYTMMILQLPIFNFNL